MSRGRVMARLALDAIDANVGARAGAASASEKDGDGANLNSKRRQANDSNVSSTKRTKGEADASDGDGSRERARDEASRARASASAPEGRRAGTMTDGRALPMKFRRALDACESTLFVARFMRARGILANADAVCANVERATGSRCTLETLRLVAALSGGGVRLRARGSRTDARRVRVEVDFGDGDEANGDVTGLAAMKARVEEIRVRMIETVAKVHGSDASGATMETWRDDFDLESVELPELAEIELEDEEEQRRVEPRLLSSSSAPILGESKERVSEGELIRTMSDLGPECKGLSKSAIQAVLERQAVVDAYNSPVAVADRERRRLYGRLPQVFDAVRSTFAAGKRRVMELNLLLDELARTNARTPVSNDELIDSIRILTRTCPEWCAIAPSRSGDEELFRIVNRDPGVARDARARVSALCRDAAK